MDPLTLTIIGIVVSALVGIPAWFPYASKFIKEKANNKGSAGSIPEYDEPSFSDNKLLSSYLNELIQRASALSFGDPSSWSSQSGDEAVGIVTLDQVWTPLRVADSQIRAEKSGAHENMTEEDTGVHLRDVFSGTTDPMLILGDPGSGKSTSIAYFALEAAKRYPKDASTQIPIWVNLASIADVSGSVEATLLSGVPETSTLAARKGGEARESLERDLSLAIEEGRGLLLLDGLDEVPEHQLARVRKVISDLLRRSSKNRIVVTCRTFDYRQIRPNRKIAIERELELMPYLAEDQRSYVSKWYDAAVKVGRFTRSQAEELRNALIVELKTEDIAEIGSSPLLLALLTLIHSEEAKLPDTRAVVADKAITYMLADAAKWRVRQAGASTLASPPVLALAIEVAFACHASEEESDELERGIGVEEINALARRICTSMSAVEQIKDVPEPDKLVGRLLNSHGLMLKFTTGRYRFAHRSFQEFLAGQYFSAGAHHELALLNTASSHWREPFRLMASLAGHEGQNLFYILKLIEDALTQSESKVASVQLASEMLTEIGRRRLALRSFNSILAETDYQPGGIGLWRHATTLIAEHVEDGTLSLAERDRSATVLGSLGDPRFSPRNEVGFHMPALIVTSKGTRQIGSTTITEETLKSSGGVWGGEPRKIEIDEFKIGRYLVTNSAFRAFINDGGYEKTQYWIGHMAKGWVAGDNSVLERIQESWLVTANEHHAKEIKDGEINESFLEEEARRRIAPRKQPFYWLDRRFNLPNQPVVGVNWWEARAYCAWATDQARNEGIFSDDSYFDLPSEFEWEYAARPIDDDRKYPWGDEWFEELAHVSTNVLNMRRPSPVGIYLEHWDEGPCDMSGNVWEWTKSLEKPYSQDFDNERFSADSLEERVVRGSSWYNKSLMAACSARAIDRSYNLFYDVGFRMVLVDSNQQRK